jgi:hypothetical protein
MVGLLLDALDVLLVSYVAGQPTERRRRGAAVSKYSALWRQLERLRQRLASVTIEPPTRVQ